MTTSQEPNEDRLDRVERILAETVAGLAEVRAVQAAAAAAHEKEMAEIRAMVQANTAAIAAQGERIAWLNEQQQRTNQDMSVIKGWQTEAVVARNAPRDFRSPCAQRHFDAHLPEGRAWAPYMNAATRNNFMTRAEADNAGAIDFLMEGTDHAGKPVMFAIEVSYTAGMEDIQRAVERAPLIAKMLGRGGGIPCRGCRGYQ